MAEGYLGMPLRVHETGVITKKTEPVKDKDPNETVYDSLVDSSEPAYDQNRIVECPSDSDSQGHSIIPPARRKLFLDIVVRGLDQPD